MNILDTITAYKKQEVAKRKQQKSIPLLESENLFQRQTLSLKQSLVRQQSTGIIAEFKRKSPSKGFIQENADIAMITNAYSANGAAGLSVLTDHNFFGGSDNDLITARANNLPILRKDFIVDEYQIIEAKSIGADVILLIAASLSPGQVQQFAKTANGLGLEVILELHAEEELEHICDEVPMVGINNRDLKTFAVDIERSLRMAEDIPSDKIKITESGIDNIEDIFLFKQNGFDGFLIGEYFMKQPDTPAFFAQFMKDLKQA